MLPVFDGLLPEPCNSAILQLLFICAHWHGLAKLRMHTDHTLEILDETTLALGRQFRLFTDVICPQFNTRELSREFDQRKRRKQKEPNKGVPVTMSRRRKTFNLETYKFHSLGDYASTIRHIGTSDSYSTQVVSDGLIKTQTDCEFHLG
jgi:hypothetical protein